MAKPGPPSRQTPQRSGRSAATREALVGAAVEVLKEEGFSGASARAIAARAGCNQALVFYHFGSVTDLLLAALDAVSTERLERYSGVVEGAGSPSQLVEVAAAIFKEDLEAGYITVLAEMIAGASATPGLGAEVAARITPWTEFARRAIDASVGSSPLASVVPAEEAAYGIVALYLGLELLSHLDGDPRKALALFDRAKQIAMLLAAFSGGGPPSKTTKGRK